MKFVFVCNGLVGGVLFTLFQVGNGCFKGLLFFVCLIHIYIQIDFDSRT